MSRWITAKPLNPPLGVSVEILEDGHGQWKRCDAFGHESDENVHLYKMARRTRPCYQAYAREADANPPSFDENGRLV